MAAPENRIPRYGTSVLSRIQAGVCPSSASERSIRPRPKMEASIVERIADTSTMSITFPAQPRPCSESAVTNGLSCTVTTDPGTRKNSPAIADRNSPTRRMRVSRIAFGTCTFGFAVSDAARPSTSKPA
ncbi:hypothetical protein D3C71_1586020 [compost metagenome]